MQCCRVYRNKSYRSESELKTNTFLKRIVKRKETIEEMISSINKSRFFFYRINLIPLFLCCSSAYFYAPGLTLDQFVLVVYGSRVHTVDV